MIITEQTVKAQMLLQLIREHKEHCVCPICGISICLFLKEFEKLKGRGANKKELEVFL